MRLDKQIRCFLERRQQALFNLRIFDHSSCWFHNKTLQRCHALKTNNRKRYYKRTVPQFEHSIFSPLPLHKKFSIEDFLGKCNQIRSFLRIWSHLQKKSSIENFIFCAVSLKDIISRAKLTPHVKRKVCCRSCRDTKYGNMLWLLYQLDLSVLFFMQSILQTIHR